MYERLCGTDRPKVWSERLGSVRWRELRQVGPYCDELIVQHEVNQEESEPEEVDGMKRKLIPQKVMYIEIISW